MIDAALRQFIEGRVMLIVGSVGADRLCTMARASGVRVAGERAVELFVSRWQWPDTVDNLLAHPAMSLTAASPMDYTCYQFKGRSKLRPADRTQLALADRYIGDTCQLLIELGVPPTSTGAWLSNRELWSVTLEVDDIYIQTPGPQAGQRRTTS